MEPPVQTDEVETLPDWHTQTISEIRRRLETGDEGLSEEEALARSRIYGANSLPERKRTSGTIIFLRQFASPLIYILLAAGVLVVMEIYKFLMNRREIRAEAP
jgi:magnesium-transporting ATPase (P-type)